MSAVRKRRPTTPLRVPLIVALCMTTLAADRAAAQYPQLPLTTIDRRVDQAEWLGLDAEGRHEFAEAKSAAESATAKLTVAPRDLVTWGFPIERGRGTHVLLVDGGVLAVETVSTDAENLQCSSAVLGPRTFPLPQVRGIVFGGTGSAAARARLFEAVTAGTTGDRDRLVTVGDDEQTGTIHSIDFRGVTMQTTLGPVVLELDKTAYLIFNPALAAPVVKNDQLTTLVGLRDGSLLPCSKLAEDADRVQLTLAAVKEAPPGAAWEVGRSEVHFLQTLHGAAEYLSDLKPAGFRHVPYLQRSWSYGIDRSVGGQALRAGGKRYLKGVGMHSTSRLTYEIPADKKRFAASVAIDDETQGLGSVTFRVFVDKEERYRSEIVRGGQTPEPIEVEVSGGATLSLVVDFADHGDELDHADWLNARFLP
ncbi:MAG: NPCBM/NEW2 domain-containing protein [Pirellulales bacterium]